MIIARTISEVMTKAPFTIGEDQEIEYAKKQLYSHSIHHLPVLSGGRCVGILSDRDLKLAYAVDHERASRLKVKDICTADVYEVTPETPLRVVAANMVEKRIGSAIIVEHGKVVGIFTTTDACRVIAEG